MVKLLTLYAQALPGLSAVRDTFPAQAPLSRALVSRLSVFYITVR